jgi:Carbon-nitrogen hydrolase
MIICIERLDSEYSKHPEIIGSRKASIRNDSQNTGTVNSILIKMIHKSLVQAQVVLYPEPTASSWYNEMLTFSSFTAWVKERQTEKYYLEEVVRKVTGQHTVPIGDAVLSTLDTAVGCETCEELFTPLNPSTYMGLNGVEIILNSSASHAELRKLRTRLDLISNSTRKVGGVYVYANATGVDGEARMMFDGSSMIVANGKVLEQGSQFSLKDVEVTTATFDIEEVRSFRSSISRNVSCSGPFGVQVIPEQYLLQCFSRYWNNYERLLTYRRYKRQLNLNMNVSNANSDCLGPQTNYFFPRTWKYPSQLRLKYWILWKKFT